MWRPPWAETFHKLLPPKVGGFGGQWRLAGARKWQRQVSDGFQQLASLSSDKSKQTHRAKIYVILPLNFGSNMLLEMYFELEYRYFAFVSHFLKERTHSFEIPFKM